MKRISTQSFAALAALLTILAVAALADVVLFFPTPEDPGVPGYARIERAPYDGKPLVHHDKDWAAIYFLRDPGCVPSSFNLLDFFDAPAAFGCTLMVEGFEIFKTHGNAPPAPEQPPYQSASHGAGAVPVWFVPWGTLKAALGDDLLTMSELNALAPLKGTASFFKETLHPVEAAQRTMLQVVARGLLADGRTFDFQSEENFQSEKNDIESKTVTTIRFK